MSPIGIAAIALAIVACLAVIAALGQMWSAAGQADDPVVPWLPKRVPEPPPPPIPRDLNSLIWGETNGWMRPEQWEALVFRLDRLESQLGGVPSLSPPPPAYSKYWLDQRLERLEALSGPLPAAMPAHVPTLPKHRWKNQ